MPEAEVVFERMYTEAEVALMRESAAKVIREASLQKARERRKRWRDKNPGYMRKWRAKRKEQHAGKTTVGNS